VAFDANVLFDSDKSALRPAGRDTLDEFVGKMKGLESQDVMAVDVTTSPTLTVGTPRLLFKPPALTLGPAQLSGLASGDGQRFVYLVPVPVQTVSNAGTQR